MGVVHSDKRPFIFIPFRHKGLDDQQASVAVMRMADGGDHSPYSFTKDHLNSFM
jgi:uncharacterized protein (DUF924 family)